MRWFRLPWTPRKPKKPSERAQRETRLQEALLNFATWDGEVELTSRRSPTRVPVGDHVDAVISWEHVV